MAARAGDEGVPRALRAARGAALTQAACGRYWRQAAGIVGLATWMKIVRRAACAACVRGCMSAWRGSRSPLRRLHGAQEATMFSQLDAAALGARDHVVDRQVRARAAVLAGPAVAREDRAAGDLAPVRVARDLDVGDEADHDRAGERRVARSAAPSAPRSTSSAFSLSSSTDGAAHRADVDRLDTSR